jgi:carboxypeptidase C (cathepsin A)
MANKCARVGVRNRLLTILIVCVWLTCGGLALAAPPAPSTAPAEGGPKGEPTDKLAVTTHQITINGAPFKYTATAGYMPLKDETGKLRANIFFIAYTKSPPLEVPDRAGASAPTTTPVAPGTHAPGSDGISSPDGKGDPTRPITFIFNGGPGAAAVWLHLGAAGPYRIMLNDRGEALPPPYRLAENQSTWLSDSDLVFIDPVSTGYSRAATPDQAKEFHNFHEDISSLGEFIRLYLTRYERWGSPKFVAGESYGGTRAAALADYLPERLGIALNGVVLISPALSFLTISPSDANDLGFALYLPGYTAAAWYHHKLPPDLQADQAKALADAEAFALTTYVTALAQGSNLAPAQRRTVLDQLARYSGLSTDYLDKANLRVDPSRFEKALLADSKDGARIIGRFDSRLTAFTADPLAADSEFDPSLSTILPVYAGAFNSYVRATLHYESDLPYEVLKHIAFDLQGEGMVYVGDSLRAAVQKNPNLKVLVAAGRFDLAVPFAATDYAVAHLGLPAPLRANVKQAYYPGGHMFYHEPAALRQFHDDVAALIRDATAHPAVAR